MTGLKTALFVSVAMLTVGLSNAQAATNHFPLFGFHLFDGLAIERLADPDRREPAFNPGGGQGGGGGIQPGIKPDDSRSFSSEYADPADWTSYEDSAPDGGWSPHHADQPDDGGWKMATDSSDTDWTMHSDAP
jgi:hypothetical protein